jgi:hypothetical protein
VTTPGVGAAPDGSFVLGTVDGAQGMTESSIRNVLKAGAVGTSGAYAGVQNGINSQLKAPIGAAVASATAAEVAASDAASIAALAKETADIAYANAQQWDKEFQVSSTGVNLGVNELPQPGVILAIPDDGISRIRKITRVIYSLGVNTGTMTVELKRRTLAGAVSTVLTTNISSAATTFPDNSIDFTVADLDHYWCNVTAKSGTASVLNCALYGVLLETP